MVVAQCDNLTTSVQRHDRTAVSDVCDVADFTNDDYNDGARTRPFDDLHLSCGLVPLLTDLEYSALSFLEAFSDRRLRVPRKAVFSDHKVVQIIPEELGTRTAAMTVIDAEERASRPCLMPPVLGLQDVQDDRDTVLIVAPHQPLIRIRRIRPHNSILLTAAFGGLVVGDDDPRAWCKG